MKKNMKGACLRPCSRKLGPHDLKTREKGCIRISQEKKNKTVLELIKERTQSTSLEVKDAEDRVVEFPRFPLVPPSDQKTKNSGVTFVLEKASLTLACVGRKYQILYPDRHAAFLRKKNMNPYKYRPEIVHEVLCEIMDSRLRMAGRLRAVSVKTDEGVLIKVEPNVIIPRSLEEFCSMMAELLQKFSIKAKGGRGKLLSLVENPVIQHLPVNSRKIGLSFSSNKIVELSDYLHGIRHEEDLVFVVGAMAYGKIDSGYIDDLISVTDLPLSAAACLNHIHVGLEERWRIW